ncbi:Transforming growth factor beta-1-induced transcript 1 protein [Coemansia sp. RSA 552]|nr:Transforming growth factor beta-1-induced transcript 1 protein [Coemansia sp. RSA 552]
MALLSDAEPALARAAVSDQTLSEALRTGDRETVEAIVQKLTGQLESLKTEALMATQSADLAPRPADPVAGLQSEDAADLHRPRLSSLPDISSGAAESARDRRKRVTMAFGPEPPEAIGGSIVCAYCGTSLDDTTSAAASAPPTDIGYCCSNCENILADDPRPDDDPAAPSPSDADYLCDTCGAGLGEEYVNVLGRRFHTTHFVCEDCSIPLYALGGYLQNPDGSRRFYCQRDYLQRFSPACHACSVQITSGEMVVALGRTYHSDCFVCSICQSPFVGDVCYEHDSQPLCEWHWYIQNGLLCTECGGIIKNQCVLTRGKKYHQTCAESKYGESAVTIEEARRQIKAAKSSAAAAAAAASAATAVVAG